MSGEDLNAKSEFYEMLFKGNGCYYFYCNITRTTMSEIQQTHNNKKLNTILCAFHEVCDKAENIVYPLSNDLLNIGNYSIRNPITKEKITLNTLEGINDQEIQPRQIKLIQYPAQIKHLKIK